MFEIPIKSDKIVIEVTKSKFVKIFSVDDSTDSDDERKELKMTSLFNDEIIEECKGDILYQGAQLVVIPLNSFFQWNHNNLQKRISSSVQPHKLEWVKNTIVSENPQECGTCKFTIGFNNIEGFLHVVTDYYTSWDKNFRAPYCPVDISLKKLKLIIKNILFEASKYADESIAIPCVVSRRCIYRNISDKKIYNAIYDACFEWCQSNPRSRIKSIILVEEN